jgi:hypothetical protein
LELEYDWWEFQFQILPWNRKQLQLVFGSPFPSSWGSFLVCRMEKLSIDHMVFSLCLNPLHWHKYSWMVKLIHPGRLLVLGYLPEVGMLLICCQSPVTHLFLSETKLCLLSFWLCIDSSDFSSSSGYSRNISRWLVILWAVKIVHLLI